MLKRTTGRLLLTLLVVTGLAGTLNNGAISLKERKRAINLIKTTKNQVFASIYGLTPRQLNYKPNKNEPSIRELIGEMVSFEQKCLSEIRSEMNQSSDAEARLHIALTDDQLLANDSYTLCKNTGCSNSGGDIKNFDETVRHFGLMRDHQVRYIRNSTEDLRNHVVKTFAGWIDCYQYYLLIADRSSFVAGRIEHIKSSPGFPRK